MLTGEGCFPGSSCQEDSKGVILEEPGKGVGIVSSGYDTLMEKRDKNRLSFTKKIVMRNDAEARRI